jgi:predicted heme/steroid binding protein/uncharacterized membrane protein
LEVLALDREELSKFDGKEGRRAYIGYKGQVYDVTDSRLWKNGQHVKRHFAGRDLTDDLEKAPHTDEVFSRITPVDALTESVPQVQSAAEARKDMLRELYRKLHPHPMFIHFPMGLLSFAVFMQALFLITGEPSFETTAFHCMAAGGVALVPTIASGFFSWWVNYHYATSNVFITKISFSVLLFLMCAAEMWLRFSEPGISSAGTGVANLYNGLLFLNLPVMAVIGFNGGKITWG